MTEQHQLIDTPPKGANETKFGDGSVMWSWNTQGGEHKIELTRDGITPIYELTEDPNTRSVNSVYSDGRTGRVYDVDGRRVTESRKTPTGPIDRSTELPDAFVNRPGHPDPDLIGRIVNSAERTYLAYGSPSYSSAVSITPDMDFRHSPGTYADNGYGVLKAPKFKHEFLLLPLARISGLEDHHLLDKGRPNYFAAAIADAGAFTMQSFKPGELPLKVRRDFLGFVANSMDWRSQDRLHIHSDILDPILRDKLKTKVDDGSLVDGTWTPLDFLVHGHQYSATWTTDNGTNQDQLSVDPVALLHDKLAAANGGIGTKAGEDYATSHMGEHSIVVVAESRQNPDGTITNGHVIIVGQVKQDYTRSTKADFANNTETYDGGFGEEWLFQHNSSNI